jgi:hypothetical protein
MIKVLHNQTFLDLAMQADGNAAYALQLARALGKSITENLTAGDYLELKSFELTGKEKSIAYVLSKKENIPASNDAVITQALGGIGYMEIGNDFIVS